MAEILDIVDANDKVVGQAEREKVHKEGLSCRFSYVWFYTPNGELILQKRSLSKKSYPGKLTGTVSGHVESGKNYFETAVIETYEETGFAVDPHKLTSVGKYHTRYVEREDYISDGFRAIFAYPFDGDIRELKIEQGEGDGFIKMSYDAVLSAIETNPELFVDFIADKGVEIINKIKSLK